MVKVSEKALGKQDLPERMESNNTSLAGKIKCGRCGYALKVTHSPSSCDYLRCTKCFDHKGCTGCGTLRKADFEQFIFTAMGEKFREFKHLRGGEETVNPKITAHQVELAQVEAEIEKLLDTLTRANATLLAYATRKLNCYPAIWTIGTISVLTIKEQPPRRLPDFFYQRNQRLRKDRVENMIFPLHQTTCFFILLVAPCTPLLQITNYIMKTFSLHRTEIIR